MNEQQKKDRSIENCLTHMGAIHAEEKLIDNIFVDICKLGDAGCNCKYQDRLEVKGYDQPACFFLCMYEVMNYGEVFL
jgi:hypothetical protein